MLRVGWWFAAVAMFLPPVLSTTAALRADLFRPGSQESQMACCRNKKSCCCRRNKANPHKITAVEKCDAPCSGASPGTLGGPAALLDGIQSLQAPSPSSGLAQIPESRAHSFRGGSGGARSPPFPS
jgi:hypothetical protein